MYILKELSKNQDELQAYFKGGTAVYKILDTMNRFSEDIDLTVKDLLEQSNTKNKNRLKESALGYEIEGLELSKENTNKDLIDGSVFNISGNNYYNNDVEVKNGKITIDKLQKGTYYVKEVSAPKGYELSGKIAKVEINDKSIFVDDTQMTETDDTITFDFENKKIETQKI